MSKWRFLIAVVAAITITSVLAPIASADSDHPDPSDLQGPAENIFEPLEAHDLAEPQVVSEGPTAKVTKNLDVVGRGLRNELGVTTDVWAHEKFAYTGTFSTLCSTGDNDSGVWVWDTSNVNKPTLSTVIDTAAGSKTNDVRVDTMNSGDILVMSNETCAEGGPGGFDIYNVDDPTNPEFLARVQTDDVNLFLKNEFGFVDFGVHNLFLFSQGENDYVAAVVESEFGNFQIFDITDPTNPELAGFWGAEQLGFPGVDWVNVDDFDFILEVDNYLFSGFGASMNRFLHDITITADGNHAYLSNWDAGQVLLDISDPGNPEVVSVAIDPENGSIDGEVNSHASWPSEDGSIVVESEEDFSVFESTVPPGINFQMLPTNVIPGVATTTVAGDDFEANQTGNNITVTETEIVVNSGDLAGNSYPALEGAGNQPKLADVGPVTGDAVWVGLACDDDPLENPLEEGDIAIVRRGDCFFSDKLDNVATAGASAIVVANNQQDSVWSGLRIWDYSDPENPVLASTFNTVCSADPSASVCAEGGTYSAHNVIVETKGNKVLAYISWYSDGVLILDVTDPYNPVEVARHVGVTEDGDPNDFWGIYKIPNKPFIYASDRNGGLYILKAKGAGSG